MVFQSSRYNLHTHIRNNKLKFMAMIKKNVFITIVFSLLFLLDIPAQNKVDTTLVKELERMFVFDQLAASNSKPKESSSSLSKVEWKDSIYRAHQITLEKLLNKNGYPGYDLVGKRGSQLFWAMVQHSDFNPDFQKRVLDSMRIAVENRNANPHNYAYLMDRVIMNINKKMVYGTQVTYHWFTGKAKYLPTIDPINLNKRRAEIGLEPIEDYLQEMTEVNNKYGNSILGGITNVALILIFTILVLFGIVVYFVRRDRK